MSENTAPEVTIGKLEIMLQAIDVASSRGAFRANEMGQIGTAYDKVSAFVNVAKEAANAAPAAAAEEEITEKE